MNNRPDSNVKDFEGRLAGTGANAKANSGTGLATANPQSQRDTGKSMHGSPMTTGKGQHA